LRSGATTVSSATPVRACRRWRMPSARKPSSLASRIFTRRGDFRNFRARQYTESVPVEEIVSKKPPDDDARLFREAVRDARQLRAEPRATARRRPAARARFANADRAAVLAESLGPAPPE